MAAVVLRVLPALLPNYFASWLASKDGNQHRIAQHFQIFIKACLGINYGG